MNILLKRVPIFLLFVSLAIGSCSIPTASSEGKTLTVMTTGYIVENIDTSYWESSTITATMFLTLYVKYAEDFTTEDIASIKIYDPDGGLWIKDSLIISVDESANTVKFSRLNHTITKHKARLGIWEITLALANGSSATTTVTISQPGKTTFPTSKYAVSTVPETDEVSAIKPGSLLSAESSTDSLVVTFSIDDTEVNNAYCWFYDASGEYLGTTGYLIKSDGTINPVVDTFSTNGTTCTITINEDTLINTTLTTWTSAIECILVTTDGKQYPSSYVLYDYRTYGPRFSITAL